MVRKWPRCVDALFVVAGLALTQGLPGCGSSANAPTPAAVFDGQWVGTTSQGLPMSFVVAGDAVTAISFSYLLYPDSPCTGGPDAGSVTLAIPAPLLVAPYGAFNGLNVPGFHSDSLSTETLVVGVSGSFSSATAASGGLHVGTKSSGLIGGKCTLSGDATWTAARKG